ncbi:MAG: phytanoyl-CoA dioxygenase family protein [Actinomycetota bacterium]
MAMVEHDRTFDLARHIDEIERDGFSIVPDVVDADEVATFRTEVLEALDREWAECEGMPGKQYFIVLELIRQSAAARRLLENERMHDVLSHFLGESCVLYASTSTVIIPEVEQYTCNIHTDTPRLVPGYHMGMLMTLALDDFTNDNGATWYLPGSHLRADKPSAEEFYDLAVRVVRRAGDAVFFLPTVWHAGGVNRTDQTRVGATMYACRAFMKQRFDYPRLLDTSLLEGVGPVGRRFLGFDARVPTSMDEFYREPEDRLYKPNQG